MENIFGEQEFTVRRAESLLCTPSDKTCLDDDGNSTFVRTKTKLLSQRRCALMSLDPASRRFDITLQPDTIPGGSIKN